MSRERRRGQSLVEFALVAPILILLAMSVWDGGSVLREQVILQQAARDGARIAASTYAPAVLPACATTTTGSVADAVLLSAADLPTLSSSPGDLNVCYPDAQSVKVQVTSVHALFTPVLRWMWGGGQGSVTLHASATFYLPLSPATVVPPPATPTQTPTPTSTPLPPTSTPVPPTSTPVPGTPTPTPTATATSTPGVTTCRYDVAVPALSNNSGYWLVVTLGVPSYLDATWTMNSGKENIELAIYADPQSNPLVSDHGNVSSLEVRTPQSNLTGSFSVYFFKQGGGQSSSPTVATLEYQSRQCP